MTDNIEAVLSSPEVKVQGARDARLAELLTKALGFNVTVHGARDYRRRMNAKWRKARSRAQDKVREHGEWTLKNETRTERIVKGEPVYQTGNDVRDRIVEGYRRKHEDAFRQEREGAE